MIGIEEIINGCRRNKRESQHRLFQLFLPYVTSICKRYLRDQSLLEDAVQESFLLAFRGIKESYQEEKGDFKPWLRRIAINSSLFYNRKYASFTELYPETNALEWAKLDFQFATDEELLNLLNAIPESYREVFNLYAIDGYKHEEIAEILNISKENSRKKLERARSFIKNKLNHGFSFLENGCRKKS